MFSYWGFGLHIISEIEFPELLPVRSGTADVRIVSGQIRFPAEKAHEGSPRYRYLVEADQLFLQISGVCTYHASAGKTIVYSIAESAMAGHQDLMREVRLYILATVFAALLVQRNALALHASAIITGHRLTLITGRSGAGKSTALGGLIKKGHRVFSDDVVVLKKGGSTVDAYASYPMIKLWGDAIKALDHEFFDDRSFPVRQSIDKYGIFFHGMFTTDCLPVERIIVLKPGETTNIRMHLLAGGEALNELMGQIYKPALIRHDCNKKSVFEHLAMLADTCKVIAVERPRNCGAGALADALQELIAVPVIRRAI